MKSSSYKINLSEDEHAYLKSIFTKLKKNREKYPKSQGDEFGKYLDSMYRKLQGEQLSITFVRAELRLLQIFLKNSILMIEKVTLPGYNKRMITPASKAKYKPYVERAKELKKLLVGLVAKIEEGL